MEIPRLLRHPEEGEESDVLDLLNLALLAPTLQRRLVFFEHRLRGLRGAAATLVHGISHEHRE